MGSMLVVAGGRGHAGKKEGPRMWPEQLGDDIFKESYRSLGTCRPQLTSCSKSSET